MQKVIFILRNVDYYTLKSVEAYIRMFHWNPVDLVIEFTEWRYNAET